MLGRPLHDRVLIKRKAADEISPGGIIIPGGAQEKPEEGVIVAVGTGRVSSEGEVTPLAVKLEDKVLFSKYGGTDVVVAGDEYIILREDDILMIVD